MHARLYGTRLSPARCFFGGAVREHDVQTPHQCVVVVVVGDVVVFKSNPDQVTT